MGKRILKKFFFSCVTIVFVVAFNFFLFRIMPGDVETIIARATTTEAVKQRLIEKAGLHRPLLEQFWIYMKDLLTGDFGEAFNSYDGSSNVLTVIMGRIPNTVILLFCAELFAIIAGLIIGVICAQKRTTKLDTGLLSGSLVLYSMPTFWFAMLLIFLFCAALHIFPTGGIFTPINILPEDYINTAKAKGFSTRYILFHHAIPNAMIPMATIIALNMAAILGGAIQLETLFSWQGLGQLMYDALNRRDYPMLQGCFFISAVAMILANFLTDVLYGFIDPRIRE